MSKIRCNAKSLNVMFIVWIICAIVLVQRGQLPPTVAWMIFMSHVKVTIND